MLAMSITSSTDSKLRNNRKIEAKNENVRRRYTPNQEETSQNRNQMFHEIQFG